MIQSRIFSEKSGKFNNVFSILKRKKWCLQLKCLLTAMEILFANFWHLNYVRLVVSQNISRSRFCLQLIQLVWMILKELTDIQIGILLPQYFAQELQLSTTETWKVSCLTFVPEYFVPCPIFSHLIIFFVKLLTEVCRSAHSAPDYKEGNLSLRLDEFNAKNSLK